MKNMENISIQKKLTEILNKANQIYNAGDTEIMSNYEYDQLYDELCELEKNMGVTFSGSPTQQVGYKAVEYLPKEKHSVPMLSLSKTKDVEELKRFVGKHKVLLSWKMDGLTVVLTYNNGELVKAVTRGNGTIGELITNNAKTFENIPLSIPYKGELILRGEAFIKYSDFERINASIGNIDARYKNPRNLCSGSIRQLNSEITASRHVNFYAFTLVKADGVDFHDSHLEQMNWLVSQGFETVEERVTTQEEFGEQMEYFTNQVKKNDFPSDGLVALYDSISYGEKLGTTAKFPRNAFAFKWKDNAVETTLRSIEWSPSRTGLINPVAVFDPVEIEGTIVSRASVHNLSVVKGLKLGIGDTIAVYKANMIIPQIAENLTQSDSLEIPNKCPMCGQPTKIVKDGVAKVLVCNNEDCRAKLIGKFELFCNRDAMNIQGLSESTLNKLIQKNFLYTLDDLFSLSTYENRIMTMEGFGKKSWSKLWTNIQAAKHVELPNFLYGLGIPHVGLSNAKVLCQHFDNDLNKIRHATKSELSQIEGVGDVMATSIVNYFNNGGNQLEVDDLLKYVVFKEQQSSSQELGGKTYVITGKVIEFKNRNEIKDFIEAHGGKVAGSVSKNTDFLINNDTESTSGKNKKAQELGVPVISEKEFLQLK